MERYTNAVIVVNIVVVIVTILVDFARVSVIVGKARTQPRPGI